MHLITVADSYTALSSRASVTVLTTNDISISIKLLGRVRDESQTQGQR